MFFAAISCLGALNGWVLLQGEVPLSLARRGVFPQWFGKVNARGMPVRAQMLGSALSALLVAANYTKGLTELFGFMALLATVATLVLYLFAAVSALRLMAPASCGAADADRHLGRRRLRPVDLLRRRARKQRCGACCC